MHRLTVAFPDIPEAVYPEYFAEDLRVVQPILGGA
jgi:hypothetical protein